MRDDSWQEAVGQFTLALQIIVAALVAGVLFFLAVVLLVVRPAIHPPGILTAVAVVFAGMMVVARAVVPRAVVAMARRRILAGTFQLPGRGPWGNQGQDIAADDDGRRLLAVYQQKTIMGAAMLEGCAFLAAIVYLAEGSLPSLALAAVLLVGIAAHFPTRGRITDWIQRQLELLEQERPLYEKS
ncbi:MAG: hypothetical protein ACLQLG_06205 [Thermoguttaceae bacterium]